MISGLVKKALITFMFSLPLFAQNPVLLSENRETYPLNNHLYLFEDKSASLKIENIINNPQISFQLNQKDYISYGFTTSAVWGKFYPVSDVKKKKTWYLLFHYNMIDDIEIYFPDRNGQYHKIKSGNMVPFKERVYNHRKFIIPFEVETNEYPVIFRFWSIDDTLDIHSTITSNKGLMRTLETEAHFSSLLLGIVILIVFYNIIIWVVVRDKTYLYYLVYIILYWATLLELNGFIYQFVFPDNFNLAQFVRNFGANTAAASAILFAIRFIKLEINFPRFTLYMTALAVILIINGTLIRNLNYRVHSYIFYITLMISAVSLIISGIISYKKYTYAKYYLAAWSTFLVILALFSLRVVNFYVPYFTVHALEFGGVVEILFLSFALAKRIQVFREESEDLRLMAVVNQYRADTFKIRNELLEKDLDLARKIQHRLIPDLKNHPDMHSVYMPMEKVGGDFFDILKIRQDLRGIFFCDVTGHGVSAAFITTLVKSVLSNEERNHLAGINSGTWLTDPRSTFIAINELLYGFSEKQYLSAMYGILNSRDRTFTFSSANHPPLIYLTRNSDKSTNLEFINSSPQAPLLGVWPPGKFSEVNMDVKTLKLQENSRLIFFSDGFLDTIGFEYNDMEVGLESFRNTPVYELLKSAFDYKLTVLNEIFKMNLEKILSGNAPVDDICLLCVEIL